MVHTVQHRELAIAGAYRIAVRIGKRGILGQTRQHRAFGGREGGEGFAEIRLRRRFKTIRA